MVWRRPLATTDIRAIASRTSTADATAMTTPSRTGPRNAWMSSTVGAISDATPSTARRSLTWVRAQDTCGSVRPTIDGCSAAAPPAM